MHKGSQEEWEKDLMEAHQKYRKLMQEGKDKGYEYDLIYYSTYYRPKRDFIEELIVEIDSFFQKSKPTQKARIEAGYKLEELALAVFHGLKGWFSVKNYQSSTAQYDLLMSGEGVDWQNTIGLLPLNLPSHSASIVVEVKATKKLVSDPQFARLCSLMQNNLKTSAVLGVFFTLNGASGRSKNINNVRFSQLRQLLFYADTGKPIVIFDINDIRQLSRNGSLLRIISRKISEIEEQTRLPPSCNELEEVILPEHLMETHRKLRDL